MLFIDNQNEHDPAVNLALEEYVLRQPHSDEDLLLLYINAPSIVVGSHQNLLEEINLDYVEQHTLPVLRRLSGGGAVYHDLGNLNFSCISNYQPEDFKNFKKFTAPVIRCLNRLGVPAQLNDRSDILVAGKKVSGNAQYVSRGRALTHGTLLFNSDLSHVSEALHVPEDTFVSKAIKSVRSPVVNISEFLSEPLDITGFRNRLLETYFEGIPAIPTYPLSALDWEKVQALAQERYRSWEWTYGRSPAFSVHKQQRFQWGELTADLEVVQGIIQTIKLDGDFLPYGETAELERSLIGLRYERLGITRVLQTVLVGSNLTGLTPQVLSEFLY